MTNEKYVQVLCIWYMIIWLFCYTKIVKFFSDTTEIILFSMFISCGNGCLIMKFNLNSSFLIHSPEIFIWGLTFSCCLPSKYCQSKRLALSGHMVNQGEPIQLNSPTEITEQTTHRQGQSIRIDSPSCNTCKPVLWFLYLDS